MYPIRTAKEFMARGYNVYCICLAGGHIQTHMEELGVDCFTTTSKAKLVMQQLLQLNNWLKHKNVTVVHSHKSGDILVSALLHWLTPRRSFFTEHMGVTRPKKDIYHKWVYRHLSRVFSISNETYQRNIHSLPVELDKITPLWLGTEVPAQRPEINEVEQRALKLSLGLPDTCSVVGSVGRVCFGKGQGHLLDAFCLLADDFPDWHLLIVGGFDETDGSDGQFVQELRAKIQNADLMERVHLTGFRKDTQKMYALMDIVCLPYHNEAFGLTTIEAMAQAKALVVSNTGALPEIVENTAAQCNPLDIEDIADKLRFLMNNPDVRREYGEQTYLRAKKEFSIDNHIQNLAEFYLR